MANEIKLKIKVTDDGNLQVISKNADKAAKSMDKAGKSARTADRNLKGAAQASANGTKNFSKMAQGITSGLVPAYATLAANVFAISAAFNFFKGAADLRVIQQSQESYAKSTGTSLSLLTTQIQDATDGILTFQDAAQAVSIGTASGLNSEQLTGLAQVAKNASLALGRDLGDSFDRLVRGATKAEPELLDELGIILRLETATEKYAKAINKNRRDLTAYQRTQAVVNEILEQGNTKFEDLGGQVNKIAKLGKAFDDLLKSIKTGLTPLAEFIAGALSNNVVALAGAFTLLGQGIVKSLVPVAPALEDIGAAADSATKRIQAALPDKNQRSKLGQNIGAGNIGGREIAALERSTTAASSKVIDYSRTTRDAVSRDVAIIKARHQAMIAENTSGWKRWSASAKAELFSLQATHGKVMGTMTAASRQFGRAASKIIGAAGLIGLLFTALGLIKELLNKLKDPALLRALDVTRAVREAAAEQNQAVDEILTTLTNKSGTVQENITELSNTIANFNVSGFEKLGASLDGITKRLAGQVRGPKDLSPQLFTLDLSNTNIEEYIGSVEELRGALVRQISILSAAGKDTEGLRKKYKTLTDALFAAKEKIEEVQRAQIKPDEQGLQQVLDTLIATARALPGALKESSVGLTDQSAAFSSFIQIGEEYRAFQASLIQTNTTYAQSLKITQDAIDSVTGALAGGDQNQRFLNFADEVKGGQDILNLLNDITEEERERITVKEVLAKLDKKRLETLEQENAVLLQQKKTEILKERAIRNTTPLQNARLSNFIKEQQIIDKINSVEAARAQLISEQTQEGSTQAKQKELELELLNEQLATVRQLSNEYLEIANNARSAFEGATQQGLAELIKGEESSIKDAMLKIAKATLSSVADTLAKQITEKITGALFGTPAQKIERAHQAGAEYAKQKIIEGHQIGMGKPSGSTGIPGLEYITVNAKRKSADLPEPSLGAKVKMLFGNLFGTRAQRDDSAARQSDPTSMPKTGEGVIEEVVASSQKGSTGLARLFTSFSDNLRDIFDADTPFLQGLKNLFGDFGSDLFSIFKTIGNDLGSIFSSIFSAFSGSGTGGGFLSTIGTLVGGFFGMANGGYARGGFRAFANGGMVNKPTLGLVGEGKYNEAIVPLPDGKSIPVMMKGAQSNNVVVNVNIDSNGNAQQNGTADNAQGMNLGNAIAAAVQKEMQNQKRSGGILNPYGVA